MLQGGGVAINKLWQLELAREMGRKVHKALAKKPIYNSFARGLAFTWFAFTLFWFWVSWTQIARIFAALSSAQWVGVWLAVWLCATAVLTLWEWMRAALLSIKTSEGSPLTSPYARVVYATALGRIALVMTSLFNQAAPVIVCKAF